jgi:hypothetical protein
VSDGGRAYLSLGRSAPERDYSRADMALYVVSIVALIVLSALPFWG